MQTSTYAHDELFTAVVDKPLKIMPVIEGGAATYLEGGHSPAFEFRADFASGAGDTSPYLTFQIVDLVQRYLLQQQDARWPSCWACVVDRDGTSRFAIMLMHVASDVILPGDHGRFAAGFDRVARSVFERTKVRIGFMLDVLPAAPNDQHSYYADVAGAGPQLANASAVLGVLGFIPEISLHSSNEAELLAFKREYLQGWIHAGIPTILDASLGYYATPVV